MILKPDPVRQIISMSVISLVMITLSFLLLFNWQTSSLDIYNLGFFIFLIVGSIIFCAFIYFRSKYELAPHGLIQQMIFKKLFYPYKEIVYIDEEKSENGHNLVVYTKSGRCVYIPLDRKKILFEEMKKRCKDVLPKDEFMRKYPNIKL